MEEQIVTPFETQCSHEGFDYNKLVNKFGCTPINNEMLERFEKVTGVKPHFWLRRGIFFAHRDLDKILDDHEAGKPIYLYTGRGPSSQALHLGHAIQFHFIKWLQDVFKAYLIIQIADDEKFFFKNLTYDEVKEMGKYNVEDIMTFGFDPVRTFIFFNREFSKTEPYATVVNSMMKHVRAVDVNLTFGFNKESNLGQMLWPIYQSVPAFSKCFQHVFKAFEESNVRCLIVHAIDQDPYFRLCRDFAKRMGFLKPSSVISKFLPSLEGTGKLSSTGKVAAKIVYVTDTPKQIAKKINRHAFSGGKETAEEQREFGANLSVDTAYKYLEYFEPDDDVLKEVTEKYSKGLLLTGEVKKMLISRIVEFLKN